MTEINNNTGVTNNTDKNTDKVSTNITDFNKDELDGVFARIDELIESGYIEKKFKPIPRTINNILLNYKPTIEKLWVMGLDAKQISLVIRKLSKSAGKEIIVTDRAISIFVTRNDIKETLKEKGKGKAKGKGRGKGNAVKNKPIAKQEPQHTAQQEDQQQSVRPKQELQRPTQTEVQQ